VGKSSLVNSLLDIDGLAMASSANSAACTCVATEFLYHALPTFEIEVEYFSRQELERQLSAHLESYRYYHLNRGELEKDVLDVCKQNAELAKDTFKAMFPLQFEKGLDLLLTMAEEDALVRLMAWVDISPHSTSDQETFENAASCAKRLREITTNSKAVGQAQLWPFIHKVRVRSNSFILSKGLILVDLPGLRDINSARRHITERYIKECDEIFAVCKQDRATSNEGVKAVIELAKKANLSNVTVGIICTRSDEIQARDAELAWQGERARLIRERTAAIAAEKAVLEVLRVDIEDYEVDWGDLNDDEKDECIRLRGQKRNAEYGTNVAVPCVSREDADTIPLLGDWCPSLSSN
jgi:hypothetical protein